MACHAVPLGNSSQLHLFFLLCHITASCCYKLFMLSSHLVTALAYIQLLMLHMYLHDVQLSHPHTAVMLYSCYMLCGLVQSLCKVSPLSFFPLLYEKELFYTQFLSSHAITIPSIRHQVISRLTTTAIPISSNPCQTVKYDLLRQCTDNSVRANNSLFTPPSCNRYQARKKVQTSLLLISLLASVCYYYIIYYNCKTQMHEHSTIIKLLIIS